MHTIAHMYMHTNTKILTLVTFFPPTLRTAHRVEEAKKVFAEATRLFPHATVYTERLFVAYMKAMKVEYKKQNRIERKYIEKNHTREISAFVLSAVF